MLDPRAESNPSAEPPPPPEPQPLARAGVTPVEALARIAVAIYHWQPAAHEMEAKLEAAGEKEAAARLRIAREEIAEALNDGGVEIEELQGKSFSEVIDRASVIAWRQQPGISGEMVCQVIEPVVRCAESIVRRGKGVMARAPQPPEASDGLHSPQPVN
jgi:hypothetical protein